MADPRFKRVQDYIYNLKKEELLDERGKEFQETTFNAIKAEFDRQGDVLKHKLEIQTNEKFELHPVQYPQSFEGWVGYNKKYAWTHPWKIIGKAFDEVKWAWQRVFRGWDDRVIWSIDYHLAKYIPVWIETLKTVKHGIPMSMYDEADFDKNFNTSKSGDEKANKKYNEILDKIKQTFLDYENMDNEISNIEEYKAKKEKFFEGFDLFRDFFDTLWD